MNADIMTLIGEATAYDKKQQLEVKRPKSWLKRAHPIYLGENFLILQKIYTFVS